MGGINGVFRKKIRASSLTEVIVATTLLMLVFAIALATLHTMMRSSLQKNTMVVDGKLNHLMYRYQNNQLKIPDAIDAINWAITIQKRTKGAVSYIVFEAIHKHSKKKIVKKLIADKSFLN